MKTFKEKYTFFKGRIFPYIDYKTVLSVYIIMELILKIVSYSSQKFLKPAISLNLHIAI